MPISIKKIMTEFQKTTNRFTSSSSSTQEPAWYLLFPTTSASLATTSTSLEQASAASSDGNKNLLMEPAPRKGSWDFVAEQQQENVKEERELESMIQCTSTFF